MKRPASRKTSVCSTTFEFTNKTAYANVASKNISVLSTVGQTSFTVAGGYRINEIAVYRNGTRLVDGRDFTATDGSIVTLVSAATIYDVIEYQIFDSFNVANAVGTSGDSTIDGNLTASGNLTATSFYGDGSNLTGVSGFATAISSTQGDFLNQVFVTAQVLPLGAGTSVSITSSSADGNAAFTRAGRIDVGTGSTLHVSEGTTFITNVLGVF